jgi:hypothetical protein
VLVVKTSGLERCERRFTGSCEQTFELPGRSTGKVVVSLSELFRIYLRLRKHRQGWCRVPAGKSPVSHGEGHGPRTFYLQFVGQKVALGVFWIPLEHHSQSTVCCPDVRNAC